MIGWLIVLTLFAAQLGTTWWTCRRIASRLDRFESSMGAKLSPIEVDMAAAAKFYFNLRISGSPL
jgi:hypothetical protein